ncbi:MAG: hypothetical protein KUG77_05185 [Nannocystaceae bacterium]|nr:hypothetical protein [Nannocystaceae bacterium]
MRDAGGMGWTLLGLLLGAGGCAVPSLDLDGRPCPCVDGWQCDAGTQTCTREANQSSGIAESSTSAPGTSNGTSTTATTAVDAESSTGTPAEHAFDVLAFSADWSASESIHWTWELQGAEEDFRAFELWIATSADALEEGDVVVVDREANPELGRFSLLNTDGVDYVLGTISHDLQPGVEYYGQLHVLDTSGGRSISPNFAVRSTTAEPTSNLVLFADENLFPPGYPLPECMDRTETAPSQGSHHFELLVACTVETDPESEEEVFVPTCEKPLKPAAECFENLRLQGMELPAANIGGGDFAEAFVELDIAIEPPSDNPAHGWWSDISIQTSDGWPGLRGITVRADGGYRRYQIPLSQMGLTAEAFDGVVRGIRLGSTWHDGVVVRLDEVRLRW